MNPQRLLPWGSLAAAACGRAFAEAMADRGGDLAARRAPHAVAVVAENLRLVTGREPAPHIARGVFATYARYYLAVMRLAHLDPEPAVGRLRWDGVEALEQSRQHGRGLLVLSAHVGMWDIVGVMLAARFQPLCTFAERLSPPALFEFYTRLRLRHGIQVVPVGSASRAPIEVLQRNGILAIVADRPFGHRTAAVSCGGARLSIPTGAIRLAIRSGIPIHTAFALREPAGFVVQCGPEIGAGSAVGLDDETRVQQVAERFGAALQGVVGAHPEQWCMLAPLAAPLAPARIQAGAEAHRESLARGAA